MNEYSRAISWYIGRKAIIAFLGPFLDLSNDQVIAWNKVRRWKRRYGMPIEVQPNGKPYLDEAVFFTWWANFQKAIRGSSS